MLLAARFSLRAIDNQCRDKVDDDTIRKVEFIVELLKVQDNMFAYLNVFSLADIRNIICILQTS